MKKIHRKYVSLYCPQMTIQPEKITLIRRVTFFGVMRAQLRVPLKPLELSQDYRIERFEGTFNWAPILPRGVSLSDSRCEISNLGNDPNFSTKKILFYFLKILKLVDHREGYVTIYNC